MGTDERNHMPGHHMDAAVNSMPNGVDVVHVTGALREHYRTVLGIATAIFGAIMLFTLLSGMEFQSSGRLYLGELDGKSSAKAEDFLSGGQGDVYSEIEILRSRSHVERAVLQSGLNVTIEPAGWDQPRYWRWLVSRRDPNLLDVASKEISAADTVLTKSAREAQTFTIEFTDATHYTVFSKQRRKLGQGQLGTRTRLGVVELKLLPGTLRGPRKGARYEVVVAPLGEMIEDVLRKLEVSATKISTASEPVKVLSLTFSCASPRNAAAFLARLMRVYLEERQTWKTEDATAAESFVTKQLSGMQRSLHDTDAKLAEFRAQHQPVVQATQAELVVAQLGGYEQQRIAARLQVAALRGLNQKLAQRNPPSEAYLVGDEQDTMLRSLGEGLAQARQRLAELDTRFNEMAPDIIQQRAQVNTQLTMIRNYVESRLTRAQQQLAALDAVIEQYEAKLRSVPGAELGLAQIGRDNDVYSRMYSYLLERQQQTAIVKASTVSKNRILDIPEAAVREYSPKLWLRLASALLGLLFGAMVVVTRSLLSKALRTESEVRSLLTSTVVFAHVPRQGRQTSKSSRLPAARIFDLLASSNDNMGFAEAFRTLRTNLYFVLPHEHGKVVLITSPSPGDGKTTTTLCLAAILSADGKRVLVIDADLRKPSHHLMTGHWPEPGLRGVLQGSGETAATHNVTVAGGMFDSISAGLGGPAELLSTRRLTDLLIRVRHDYDFILLDSPSYPLVSDALVLARQSDFVLSVVRIGSTPRRLTEEHVRGLVSKTRGHALIVNNSDVAVAYGYPGYGSSLPLNADRLLVAKNARLPHGE
jgi:tyrosine-protein kinase Etk/Wzc